MTITVTPANAVTERSLTLRKTISLYAVQISAPRLESGPVEESRDFGQAVETLDAVRRSALGLDSNHV